MRKVEAAPLEGEWKTVRKGIEVKHVDAPDGRKDTFILCRSADRRQKEAAIHDRFERRMEERLTRLEAAVGSARLRSRDVLHQRLGRIKYDCSRVARAYNFLVEGDGKALSFSWSKDQARKIIDAFTTIKSGDIILPLVDGRELRLRRVSRPDPRQAGLLTKLGLELPKRIGPDPMHDPRCSTDLREASTDS